MSIEVINVIPIIVTPNCIKTNKKQDCFNCSLFSTNECISPRKLCAVPYKDHPYGCPKYGSKNSCPPNAPMFDEVFDTSKKIYAIISTNKSNEIAKKNLITYINKLKKQNYYACLSPEALGVDLTQTLKNILEWPITNSISRVALLGQIKNSKYIDILN